MFKKLLLLLFLPLISWGQAPLNDSLTIRAMFDEALLRGHSYENLRSLCKDVGNRLSGSEGAEKAVIWGLDLLHSYNFDTVWLQPIEVPKWTRGTQDEMWLNTPRQRKLQFCALGGSVATNGNVTGELVLFPTLEDLQKAKPEDVAGKVVLLNEGFDQSLINTFAAYGPCSSQRFRGASEAAKKGAIACVVRSAGSKNDEFPHTGSMRYEEGVERIPTGAVSVMDANYLADLIASGGSPTVTLKMNCKYEGMVPSHNVIADLKGSEFPEKVIVVGGHLDSWDVGEGAHDDGAGIIHAIEALRIFQELGISPKHTLRVVLYMNEENGNNGGKSYANLMKKLGVEHVAAIESDRGGFVPRGFSFDTDDYQLAKAKEWKKLLAPYNLHIFKKGYSGVDIKPLKNGKTALIGFVPDPQRYFDFHHTENDVFENVHKRELELGCASIAALLYLIDKYGFAPPKP